MEIRHNNIEDIQVVESIGNYGDIVSKSVTKQYIDYDGDIQSYSSEVFNVKLNDGRLVVDEWFDIYEPDCHGNCIIGYERTMLECSELWDRVPLYRSDNDIAEQFKYRMGAINSNGILAVYPMYDRLTFNNEDSYTAYHNGRLGYVDSIDGHQITPIVFQSAQPFFEHKAAVEFRRVMGYVSRNRIMRNPHINAEYAIAPKYDTAGDFENGQAEVSENGEFYVIDENGKRYSKDEAKKQLQLK